MKKNVLLVFTIITVFVVLLFSFRSSLVSSSESNDFKAGIKKYDPRSVDSEHVEGEIIVKFKKDLSSLEQKRAVISSIGAKSFKNLDSSGHVRIRLSEGDTVEEALKRYAEDENVEYLEPNFIVRLALAPDDPAYPNTAPNGGQWGLKNVGQTLSVAGVCTGSLYTVVSTNPGTTGSDIAIESLWTEHTDCSSVVVAVIDTGIKYDHQDFIGNMWDGGASYLHHGWDFVNNDNNPMDDHNYAGSRGHGTHVSGVIGAVGDNTKGISGVCWKASLMALKTFDSTGSAEVADIILALDFAIKKGAKVVNLSIETTNNSTAFSEKIAEAGAAGILLVVAAGNDGVSSGVGKNVDTAGKVYPCSYTNSNILCVAALDQKYGLAGFSNYGAVSVDVGAPGTNICSTSNSSTSDYLYMNGTSMATPYATGLAALLISYHRNAAGNFGMTGIHARDIIMRSGRTVLPLVGKTTTGKAIDATNVFDYIATPYGVTGTVQQ